MFARYFPRLAGPQLQVLRGDFLPVTNVSGALKNVFQLTHVAREGIVPEQFHGLVRQARWLHAESGGEPGTELPGQEGDILDALPQARHRQLNDIEPIVQVLPEMPARHEFVQVLVGRAQDAHIHLDFSLDADRADGFFLNRAQQFHLHGQRQVTDLVEKQRAAVGGLEQTFLVLDGAGETAFLWPKNSLSIRFSGMAPQFTGTKGLSARGPSSCMRRAASSLPVPDSPLM